MKEEIESENCSRVVQKDKGRKMTIRFGKTNAIGREDSMG